jgi:hypothetical protein
MHGRSEKCLQHYSLKTCRNLTTVRSGLKNNKVHLQEICLEDVEWNLLCASGRFMLMNRKNFLIS